MQNGDQGGRGDAVLSAGAYEGKWEGSAAGEPVGGVAGDAEESSGGDHVGGGAERSQLFDTPGGPGSWFVWGWRMGVAMVGQGDSRSFCRGRTDAVLGRAGAVARRAGLSCLLAAGQPLSAVRGWG
jgi:hypothetical protein